MEKEQDVAACSLRTYTKRSAAARQSTEDRGAVGERDLDRVVAAAAIGDDDFVFRPLIAERAQQTRQMPRLIQGWDDN